MKFRRWISFRKTLVPGKIRDVRTFDYQLQPQGVVPQRGTAHSGREPASRHADVDRRRYARLSGQPAVAGPDLHPAPGTPGGPPVGGQPYYQLPPGPWPRPCRAGRADLHAAAQHRAGCASGRRANLPAAAIDAAFGTPGHRTSVRSPTIRCLRLGQRITSRGGWWLSLRSPGLGRLGWRWLCPRTRGQIRKLFFG